MSTESNDGDRRLVTGLTDAVNGVSRATGALLALATKSMAALRPAAKPLHPHGQVWEAVIHRSGTVGTPMGVAWLDEPGQDDALVRLSSAVGLWRGGLDIQGIAIRLLVPEGSADLLLASTGSGRVTRFLLRPTRPSMPSICTTLLPYQGPRGPVMLGAVPTEPCHYNLVHASTTGTWETFAHLQLIRHSLREPSYDPIQRPLSGLDNYSWVSRLRAPAYRTARRSRGHPTDDASRDGDG